VASSALDFLVGLNVVSKLEYPILNCESDKFIKATESDHWFVNLDR